MNSYQLISPSHYCRVHRIAGRQQVKCDDDDDDDERGDGSRAYWGHASNCPFSVFRAEDIDQAKSNILDILDNLLSDLSPDDLDSYYQVTGRGSDNLNLYRTLRSESKTESSFHIDWKTVRRH